MRTSLTEIEQLEHLLLNSGKIEDRLITEAKVLTDNRLKDKAFFQSLSYRLIKLHGREKLLKEVKSIEYELFKAPKYKSFQDRIRSIFK